MRTRTRTKAGAEIPQPNWLKDCEICSAGLCAAVEAKKAQGLNEFAACRALSEEAEQLYTTKQILDRYRYHTGKDKKVSEFPNFDDLKTEMLGDLEVVVIGKGIKEKQRVDYKEINKRTLENQILKEASNIREARKKDAQEARKAEPKEIDNFDRLRKSVRYTIEGLTAWADKRMKPESEDEAIAAKAILGSAANMIVQFSRLGVDVEGILNTFVQGNDHKESQDLRFKRAKSVN